MALVQLILKCLTGIASCFTPPNSIIFSISTLKHEPRTAHADVWEVGWEARNVSFFQLAQLYVAPEVTEEL